MTRWHSLRSCHSSSPTNSSFLLLDAMASASSANSCRVCSIHSGRPAQLRWRQSLTWPPGCPRTNSCAVHAHTRFRSANNSIECADSLRTSRRRSPSAVGRDCSSSGTIVRQRSYGNRPATRHQCLVSSVPIPSVMSAASRRSHRGWPYRRIVGRRNRDAPARRAGIAVAWSQTPPVTQHPYCYELPGCSSAAAPAASF